MSVAVTIPSGVFDASTVYSVVAAQWLWPDLTLLRSSTAHCVVLWHHNSQPATFCWRELRNGGKPPLTNFGLLWRHFFVRNLMHIPTNLTMCELFVGKVDAAVADGEYFQPAAVVTSCNNSNPASDNSVEFAVAVGLGTDFFQAALKISQDLLAGN